MRKKILVHLLLVLVWLALTGEYTWVNFVFGFIVSYFALWLVDRTSDTKKYIQFIPRFIGFILFFIWELVKSNVMVAYEVATPSLNMKPGIVAFPMDVKSDLEIIILTSVIALTPGTSPVQISQDKRTLYIHGMNIGDRDEFVRDIKEGFERRIIQLFE